MLEDLGVPLGVVHRKAGSPLGVGDERRAELGVVRKAGVVGREAEQRDEAMPLLGRNRKAAMVHEHLLVAAKVLRVAGGAAQYLRPPDADVRSVLLAHPAGKVGREEGSSRSTRS